MKLLKSKRGFTLIELLVVIGILAVLAAIAIPSVAGLIDRANVSADKTNANEMTNAIERFASEYEIVRQDLMSGLITDINNLDGAQGRVYYVTRVVDQNGIENLEKDATADYNTTGRAIYRDTKYPVNIETMQAVVEAYIKTSSSTFEPKQSDKHYYYSPDCGLVVVAGKSITDPTKLNTLVISGMDAKGNALDANTKWINITSKAPLATGSGAEGDSVTEVTYGATFTDGTTLTWEELKLVENGNKYGYDASKITDTSIGEWPFVDCASIVSIVIPDGVTSLGVEAFAGCQSLKSVILPDSVTDIGWCAFNSSPITTLVLPQKITCIGNFAFGGTHIDSAIIPDGVTKIGSGTFGCCTYLRSVTIPNSVSSIDSSAFEECFALADIKFEGTKAQWNNIEKHISWNFGCSAITVTCIDGTIAVPSYN